MNTRTNEFKFTYFGAWDAEVRAFLKKVANAEKIEQWLYSDGVVLFQQIKKELTKADHFKRKSPFSEINSTRLQLIAGETMIAFSVVLEECLLQFVPKETWQYETYEKAVEELIEDVIKYNYYFHSVQAQVLNFINIRLSSNPDLPSNEIYKMTVDHFQKARSRTRDSTEQMKIDRHLQLMHEFMAKHPPKPSDTSIFTQDAGVRRRL